jgi:hypothetical protein
VETETLKTLKLLIIAMVLSVACFAQADKDTYTANAADLTAQTFTFLHAEQNSNYGISHQLEFVWGSAPATASITESCVMRGGTTAATMFASTSTANQTQLVIGLCDLIKSVVSWTGSPSSVKLNITGSVHFAQSSGVTGAMPTSGPQLIGGIQASTGFLRPYQIDSTGSMVIAQPSTDADGIVNTAGAIMTTGGATGLLFVNPHTFNGSTWDRQRSESATNASNSFQLGVNLVDSPGQWAIFNQPGAATQATTNRPAVASTKHVAKSITVCISAVAAQPDIIFNLRDGASGAGTVVWTVRLAAVAGTSQCQTANFTIIGSNNTAMAVESAVAPAATNFASVSLSGYDIQ